MPYPSVFELVATELQKANVAYLLIGGFALNSYGVTRQTLDVDFMIAAEDDKKVQVILYDSGYKEVQRQDVFARFKSPRSEWMDIDFMFVDRETLQKMLKEGKTLHLAGQKFVAPSLNHLIALKLHSLKHNFKIREYKDMADILKLIEANHVDVKKPDFKALCEKYGTAELYATIIKKASER